MNETRPSPSSPSNPVGATPAATASQPAAGAEVVDRMKQSAHEAVDRVAAAAAPTVEKLHASATSAAQTLQAKADEFGAMEEQWVASARSFVREHPLASVAAAALVGLLIGKASGHGHRGD